MKPPARTSLPQVIARNPFLYITQAQAAELFNLGEHSMRKLMSMGAPTVAKKLNPEHFKRWLWMNRERIGKLGDR